MFFISGITGKVGSAAASHLLAKGHAVRALVRDPSKALDWIERGVEILLGDFDKADTVAAALKGVEGAFLMMPPVFVPSDGYPEAKATAASFQKALSQSPPPRLVLLSSFGSQQNSGLGNITATHILEQALADLPYPTAFVRPGSFVENYLYGLQQAESTGVFDTFLPPTTRKVPMAATTDIGRTIGELLLSSWKGRKIIDLGTRYSANDLAMALEDVLGRPVEARSIPRDRWAETLEHMGIPNGATYKYQEMMDGINSGWIDFGVAGTEQQAGTVTPAEVFASVRKTG